MKEMGLFYKNTLNSFKFSTNPGPLLTQPWALKSKYNYTYIYKGYVFNFSKNGFTSKNSKPQ